MGFVGSDSGLDDNLGLLDLHSNMLDNNFSNYGNSGLGLVNTTPTELFELYVMDMTQYHVDCQMTPKSREFVRGYFAHMSDTSFKKMARMDKRSLSTL